MEKCESLFALNFKPINKLILISEDIVLKLESFQDMRFDKVEWKACEPRTQFENLYECRLSYKEDNTESKVFAFCFRLPKI